MWTLSWKEKPEGGAREKRSGKINLAQDQAGVDRYVGPSQAPEVWFPHTSVRQSDYSGEGCSNGGPWLRDQTVRSQEMVDLDLEGLRQWTGDQAYFITRTGGEYQRD